MSDAKEAQFDNLMGRMIAFRKKQLQEAEASGNTEKAQELRSRIALLEEIDKRPYSDDKAGQDINQKG